MKKTEPTLLIIFLIFFGISACDQNAQQKDEVAEDAMEMPDKHMQERHEEMNEEDLTGDMHEEDHSKHQASPSAGKSKSPRKTAMATIGDAHVHIDYSAPSKRGRQIFGGLVAYDEVWVTGAHRATSIEFDDDVLVNGEKVEEGKYGLFTIPGKDEWTVILNENYNQHLADEYDQSEDVLRFNVTPTQPDEPVEQLTFNVTPEEGQEGTISIAWDQTKISFPVKAAD